MHPLSPGAGSLARRAVLTLLTAVAALSSGACEPRQQALMTTPEPLPLRLTHADLSYRLPDTDREKILPGFDVEAVERLLGMTRPDMRQEILQYFQKRDGSKRLGHLMGFDDPELQKVLEEVWAPMWDHVGATDAQIEANDYGFPGREIAQQRRAARARTRLEGSE